MAAKQSTLNDTMSMQEKFKTFLKAPIDGRPLGLFRIIFGLFMVYEMADYFAIDLIKNTYVLPKVQLAYEWFEWMQPLPEPAMNLLLGLMLVCAVLIAVGFLFRPACLIFGSLYLYFFLLDISLYNNHIYLFILLSFLLSFTHADHFYSVKNLFGKAPKNRWVIKRWETFILQLQFAIVYFYGGLAKLNYDWLVKMEPMKGMVEKFPSDHGMAFLLKNDFMVPFLTYGGALFDLAIPFLLWKKSTRKWALIPLVLFHLPNSQIFGDIGIFPFVMLLATIVFFEASEIPFMKKETPKKGALNKVKLLPTKSWVPALLAGYFVFQFLFPFRGHILPNDMDWTSIGNRFSWRMKIQAREINQLTFFVQDGPNGQQQEVGINTFLNTMQLLKVAHGVRAVRQTALMLEKEMLSRGFRDPQVKARIQVEWNGKQASYFVDPGVDLTSASYKASEKLDWVMPKPKVN